MNIRQIFQPMAIMRFGVIEGYQKFDEFVRILEGTQPDFDEETECSKLNNEEFASVIISFSMLTGITVNEISKECIEFKNR